MAAVFLSSAQQRRLTRLAKEAGCQPQDLMDDVFKYGFEFVEHDVRETNIGIAEADAGQTVPNAEVMRGARQIVETARARKQKQAA